MHEPRYALFEPTPSRMVRTQINLERDHTGRGARGGPPGPAPFETAHFETAPAKVTFMGPSDAAQARAEGKAPMPAPRMPIQLIPQVAESASAAVGEPWGIQAIGADKSRLTGAGVCVAVLDSGIDASHPAFDGLINETNYMDFTRTGLTDTIGHGTHCAGIIFGRDLDLGTTRIGVARGVTRVLIAKIAERNTITSTALLEEALIWAVREGADVISMSIGLDFLGHARQLQAGGIPQDAALALALADYRLYARFFDSLMSRVISAGEVSRSALVVAAAGNDSHADGTPPYRVNATLPAIADGVLAVGAVGRGEGGRLSVAPFSNTGANVCAPGVAILSALPGGGTGALTGTSQSAPHAAGVAALWWEKVRTGTFSSPKPAAVRDRISGGANFAAVSPPATAEEIGNGLVIAP